LGKEAQGLECGLFDGIGLDAAEMGSWKHRTFFDTTAMTLKLSDESHTIFDHSVN
jgi:hypothetical protein